MTQPCVATQATALVKADAPGVNKPLEQHRRDALVITVRDPKTPTLR